MSHARYVDVIFRRCICDVILARTINNIVVKISRVFFVTGGEAITTYRREPALTTRRRTVRSICIKSLLRKRLTFRWNIWTFRDIISNTFRRPLLHVDVNHAVLDLTLRLSLFAFLPSLGILRILDYEYLEIFQNIDLVFIIMRY